MVEYRVNKGNIRNMAVKMLWENTLKANPAYLKHWFVIRWFTCLIFISSLGALCSCSKNSGVPEEINRLSERLTEVGTYSHQVKSDTPSDMLLIVVPYITENGVKKAISDRYALRASALAEVVETMGFREDVGVFVFRKGRIVDQGWLSGDFYVEDSTVAAFGDSTFSLSFTVYDREWRPIEVGWKHKAENHP